jgi:Transposase DDE domain
MLCYVPRGLGSRFHTLLRSFAHDTDHAFLDLLPEQRLAQIAAEEEVVFAQDPEDVYTPAVTLWAFLTQVLSGSKSCVAAVARVIVLMAMLERPIPAAGTGAYCKARAKLPERFLRRLTATVATEVEDQAPDDWRWHGRRVLLADGFEVTLADTPDNQKKYPQPSSQKPGLGFPLMRVVVLLTFATAVLLDAASGPHQGKETGEPALFRQLLASLREGDVVVADRYYCSYWLVALLQAAGVDVVFRLHQRRHYDFRRGQRLGAGDHVVVWAKPAKPEWMDAETYAGVPATLTVREVRVTVTQPGFRSRQIIVATTLRDAQAFPRDAIGDAYHWRWHVELDIRAIKQTLRMEHLRCKTPEMAQRELWVHLLAYNLVRQVAAAAAQAHQHCPRHLSLSGTLHTLEAFRWSLLGRSPADGTGVDFLAILLLAVATHRVGNRPDRVEPRQVKRRPKNYPRMTKPRAQARQALLGR